MNFTNDKVEYATSARALLELVRDFQWITTMNRDMYEGSSADPATKYLVTFEMTIKPLPEEPSTSGSHPHTDGSER